MEKNRLRFVDALRGVAVCGTIMVHTGAVFGSIGPRVANMVGFGGRGVQLFFILSAFTIFYSFKNRNEHSTAGYFIRRFFRIAPLFYTVLLISFCLTGEWSPSAIINLGAKLLFIDNLNPLWVTHAIIGVEWTIGVEMLFYVLAPYAHTHMRNLRSSIYVLAGALIIFCVGILPQLPSTPIDWNLYKAFSFFMHLHSFALGIVVFFLFERYEAYSARIQRRLSVVCAALLLLLIVSAFGGLLNAVPVVIAFAIAFFLLFFASASSIFHRLVANPVLVHIGKISFSAYLLHLLVYDAVIYAAPHIPLAWSAIISFITTMVVSTVTYYYIEKPGIRFGHQLAQKVLRASA